MAEAVVVHEGCSIDYTPGAYFMRTFTDNAGRSWAKSDRAAAVHTSSSCKEQELRERADRRDAKAAEYAK